MNSLRHNFSARIIFLLAIVFSLQSLATAKMLDCCCVPTKSTSQKTLIQNAICCLPDSTDTKSQEHNSCICKLNRPIDSQHSDITVNLQTARLLAILPTSTTQLLRSVESICIDLLPTPPPCRQLNLYLINQQFLL